MSAKETEALKVLAANLLSTTAVLELVVAHLVAHVAKQDQDPPDALRRLSEALNAAIDRLPFGVNGPEADRYVEAHRREIDKIIQTAAKLAGGE